MGVVNTKRGSSGSAVIVDYDMAISATAIAAGGSSATSPQISDLDFVRNMVLHVRCDQPFSVIMTRINAAGLSDTGTIIASSATATGTSNQISLIVTGANAVIGYAAKFSIKNDGSASTTTCKLSIQFLG